MTDKSRNDLAPAENKLKRKRDDADQSRKDVKLQEYLEVMQPPSKSKTWANEDISGSKTPTVAHLGGPPKEQDGESDEEYQKVSKQYRHGKTNPEPRENSKNPKLPIPNTPDEFHSEAPAPSHIESLPANPTVPAEFPQEVEEGIVSTDTDWLRTRTSRLLGLTDNEEDLNRGARERSAPPNPEAQVMTVQSETSPVPEVETTRDQEPRPGVSPIADGNLAAIELSGRLFIRNLPYSTLEDDLREFFSAVGGLDEVRQFLHSTFHLPSMMNNLIGTAYALHVMLPQRVF